MASKAARRFLLGAALLAGIAARLAVGTLGYNYDLVSYTVVARIVEDGGNVYAGTPRYNYAPPWSFVVHRLAVWACAFPDAFAAFQWLLTILLTLVDVAVALLLLERFGAGAAALFFLNPVSVFISGYHRQFDNVAVLLGMLAVASLDGPERRGRTWFGAGLLGLSLAVKHVLFAFPLWLAVRERRWRDRIIVLAVPVALFLVGFLPYLPSGASGIMHNVFLYRGYDNAPLWHALLPGAVRAVLPPAALFLSALAFGAFALRRFARLPALLVYLLILVTCAPAISNQALAIVAPATAVFPNAPFALFTADATVHLMTDKEGLKLAALRKVLPAGVIGYQAQACLLLAGILWLLFGRRLRDAAKRLRGTPPGETSGPAPG